MYADEYVTKKDDLPTEPHWAILKYESFTVPGDERSRTNPGHGYPAHTEYVVKYEAYFTEESFLEAIQELEEAKYGRTSYTALKVEPLKIEKTVTISAT